MSFGIEGKVREIIIVPSRFSNSCAKLYYQKNNVGMQEIYSQDK